MTVSEATPPEFGPDNLELGDILLCDEKDSALGTWMSCADKGSPYQHAAIYVGSADDTLPVIDASPRGGVARIALSLLLDDAKCIDVYRFVAADGAAIDRGAVAAQARRLLGRRYNFTVIPHFVTMFKKECCYPVAAAWDFVFSGASAKLKRGAAGMRPPLASAGKTMTCSQFIVLCYAPHLDGVVAETTDRVAAVGFHDTLASLAADQLDKPKWRRMVSAAGAEDDADEMPDDLLEQLADFASAVYPPPGGPMPPIVPVTPGDEPARVFGIADRRAALRKLHADTVSFVTPGDLSRSALTRCVGRIPGAFGPATS
jgi:hypothetical protein